MQVSADVNIQHSLNTALNRISVALQLLERYTQLSEQQRQFVNAALQGVADLDMILRDDVYRRLSEQAAVPSNN